MKKNRILLISLFLFFYANNFGQSALKKGHIQLNGGSDLFLNYYISADYAFHNDMTLGFEFTSRKSKYISMSGRYDQIFVVNGRVLNLNYHTNTIWDMSENWDVYIGPNFGYYHVAGGSTFYAYPHYKLGGQLGLRYFFLSSLGINVEVSYVDAARVKGGLSLRL